MSDTRPIPTTAPRPRRRVWPWAMASIAVLGATGYAALALSTGAKVPGDTSVGGVRLGGLTHDEALAALRTGLGERASARIPVTFGDQSIQLDPAAAGLSVDYAESIDGLTGAAFNPLHLYDRLTGSIARDPARTIDRTRLSGAIAAATEPIALEPTDAQLAIEDGKAVVTPAVDGTEADVGTTADAVAENWLINSPIAGAVQAAEPDVTTAEAEQVKSEVADAILSAPVVVKVQGAEKTFKVTAGALAPAVRFQPANGSLEPRFDDRLLVAAVRRAGTKADVLTKGRDAEVTSANGSFTVRPSVDGLDIDTAAAPEAVRAAMLGSERTANVPGKATPAKLTTAKARATLPTGVISTFTTNFPYAPDRTHNITLAARALNGTYVAPGETFSLNAHLGQRTAQKGYRAAPVIYDGRLTKDYGGGISQVSTTLFNAVFFSGARIDQHHPHSFYISRYPEGREATISWPNVDNRFTNTTKGGILITTKVGPNSITVSFQGRKTWEIEATKGPRVNLTSPREIRDDSAGCVPQSKQDGFDVTVGRIFKQSGKVVKTEYYTTRYIPEDLVTCTNP